MIWRGPVIANMVKQFWSDVIWGELDFLFVDMPPGTGDVPLTVFQSLPVEGIVIVSSPQDLVRMIVTKAFNMAKAMKFRHRHRGELQLPCLSGLRREDFCSRRFATRRDCRFPETEVLEKMPIDRLCFPAVTAKIPAGKIRTWMQLWKSSTSSTVRIPKTTKNKKKRQSASGENRRFFSFRRKTIRKTRCLPPRPGPFRWRLRGCRRCIFPWPPR